MFINELPEGSTLTITAFSDDKKAELGSEVLTLSENDRQLLSMITDRSHFSAAAAVTLFMTDHQVINFSSENVQCDCIGIYENLPYLWEKVKITRFDFPGAGSQHIIFSSHDAHSFNRRKDFRLWLGMECTLTFGSPAQSRRGTIKDISVTGMGLLTDKDCKIERGSRIKVQFAEKKTTVDGDPSETVYTVIAQAVRFAPVNERTQLIGSRIVEGSREYVTFLYKKQREAMQREKGTDL